MKALLIGATGATGKDLVKQLLQHPGYSSVVVFLRRPLGIADPKLKEVLTDFDQPEKVADFLHGDVLFCCLGTTLKLAGSKDKQRHIDLEIPLRIAGIARTNGVPQMVLVSAYGASPTSSVFYSRLKGELEQGIEQLSFSKFVIFRPGLLLRKQTDRPGERFSASLLNGLNRIGLFKRFKPLPTQVLAEKLAKAPLALGPGKHIVALDQIFSL